MLVLSRKVGEAIIISDNIRITLVDIRGDKVRLGIVAPKEIIVDRQEVHEKRKQSQEEARPGAGQAP
jgi:carbon storage regulator